MAPKNQIIKQGDRAYLFNPFNSSRRDSHFSVFVCQNWMKNGQSYDHGKRTRQSGIWPILCQLMAILAKFLRYGLQTCFA